MNRLVRFTVVGAGTIGEVHASVITRRSDAVVAAVVNRSPDRAEQLADRLVDAGAPRPTVATSLGEVLDGCDAVVVCTPSGLHAEHAVAALTAGKHTLIEKPLAVDLTAAARVRDAQDSSTPRPVASVVSQHRFDPGSRDLSELLHRGALGRITSAAVTVPWWRPQEYYDSAAWRGTVAGDGGALMNQGVHTLDLLLWLLGTPARVYAEWATLAHRIEAEDTLVATLRFRTGTLATVLTTTAARPGLPSRLQLHGTAGSAVLEDDVLLTVGDTAATTPVNASAPATAGDDPQRRLLDGLDAQYSDLLRCIRTGDRPQVTVADGLRTLRVVGAIYESARSGRPLSLATDPNLDPAPVRP